MILDKSGKINPEDSSSSATLDREYFTNFGVREGREGKIHARERRGGHATRGRDTCILGACFLHAEIWDHLQTHNLLPTLSKIKVLPLKPPSSNEVALILVCPAHSYSTNTSWLPVSLLSSTPPHSFYEINNSLSQDFLNKLQQINAINKLSILSWLQTLYNEGLCSMIWRTGTANWDIKCGIE